MLSFFSKHSRVMMSGVMICVVFTMLFFGVGGKNLPQKAEVKDVVYQIGEKQIKRRVFKKQIDSMKTYLSYDLGYGFNDVLERQNIFSDGFFVELISSALGKKLVYEHYDLLKDDFATQMKKHRRQRMYKHPSGKVSLEGQLKIYAKDFHASIKKVDDKKREIDVSLLVDMIDMVRHQIDFTPHDMRLLMKICLRDYHNLEDPMLERKNMAIFQARNNEDLFGSAFMELFAQVVLEGAAFAKDHGFSVSYEEAEGVVLRKAKDLIDDKFQAIENEKQYDEVLSRFEYSLGLSRKDLVKAAQAVMTFEKMLKNNDNSLLIDQMALSKLFGSKVETLIVDKVEENRNLAVTSVQDALELNAYLTSIGEQDEFLMVPKKTYDESVILKKAPNLFTKNYVLKMASRSKLQVGNDIALKKLWKFQTGDGWDVIAEKFSLEKNLSKDERFYVLQSLSKAKQKDVDAFSRHAYVDSQMDLVKEALKKQDLSKVTFYYNENVKSNHFPEGFDETKLMEEVDKLNKGEELSFYSQDDKLFFRVMLLKKPEKASFTSFAQAKENGFLAKMVEDEVMAAAKDVEMDEELREKLLFRMLEGKAGKKVAAQIQKCEKNKKVYGIHQFQRLGFYKEGKVKLATDEHLKQFNLDVSKIVITRNGKESKYARDSFFKLKIGDTSKAEFSDAIPFYITLKEKKIDQGKLKKLSEKLREEMCKEARKKVYDSLAMHITENGMLEHSRFKGRL
ncbi:MAG: hypothetical protein S4CHLAM20_15210 [Chlamydiia bacterium]|nr:hypothetical protein [Chlamydiia bacterium]